VARPRRVRLPCARSSRSDDGQGAALARFAHERGIRRLAIVRDDTGYGRANAFYARREAQRLGLTVIGPYAYRDVDGPAPAHAIARSDGSRASVTRALLATRIDDGLVGAVSFDADGDVRPRPYHFFRLTPKPLPAGEAPAIAAVISP
jgi:ABC-type branched-subunit amino acid transport system substrate-binding protein